MSGPSWDLRYLICSWTGIEILQDKRYNKQHRCDVMAGRGIAGIDLNSDHCHKDVDNTVRLNSEDESTMTAKDWASNFWITLVDEEGESEYR